jgi:hypothetical protein
MQLVPITTSIVSSNLDTALCDQVCRWLVAGQCISLGTPVSSTNKTDHHNITEILLKSLMHLTFDCLPNGRLKNLTANWNSYKHNFVIWLTVRLTEDSHNGQSSEYKHTKCGPVSLKDISNLFRLTIWTNLGGGDQSTQRNALTCRKSPTNLIT